MMYFDETIAPGPFFCRVQIGWTLVSRDPLPVFNTVLASVLMKFYVSKLNAKIPSALHIPAWPLPGARSSGALYCQSRS